MPQDRMDLRWRQGEALGVLRPRDPRLVRVTQSLFAVQSWLIIAPLCSLLRVGPRAGSRIA